MHSRTIFLSVLFGFQVLAGQAQDCEKLQALFDQGIEEKQNRNYAKAFEILTHVGQKAEQQQCYLLLCSAKNEIGRIYSSLSLYAQSLDYYQKALEIAQTHESLNKHIPVFFSNIGYLYYKQENHEKAFEYYKKAYELSKKYNVHYWTVINLADLYMTQGRFDKAFGSLEEVHEKIKKEVFKQQWKITYAEVLHSMGKTQQAQKIAETMYLEIKKKNNRVCYICVLKLLSQIYADQNKMDKAIAYAQKGLQNTTELDSRIELYGELASFYAVKRAHRQSSLYKDSVIIAMDSLSQIMNRHLFQINRVKFEVQEYQNQIKQNLEKQWAERILFFILIGFGLISFLFVFKALKTRAVKQKQKRAIAENKEKIALLQLENEKKEHHLLEEQSKVRQEQLKNKITQKNRMLSANALYHSGRNELLEKIISSLSNSTVSDNKVIKGYIKELKSHLKTDSKGEEFTTHFKKVKPEFLKNLKARHPELTKRDIRFLCCLYLNLDPQEICMIFNITLGAIWKRKQRLAKKMGLQTDELEEYILGLA